MNVFSRGVRNAFRNGIRTTSIVLILGLSIGLALSMLVAREAVEQKITSVKSSIASGITVSPAGVRGFEGGGDPLTADQISTIEGTDHVASVTSTLSARLTSDDTSLTSAITAGKLGEQQSSTSSSDDAAPAMPEGDSGQARSFTPSITVTGTTDTTTTSETGAVTLSSGEQIDGSSDENVALIGSGLAEANDLSVGSTFTAYGETVTVKGIIDTTSNRFAGNMVIMPLSTVQRLSDQDGYVSSVSVTVDSIENTDAVTTALETALGDAADVVNGESTAEEALSPLESIKTITLYGLIAAVAAGAVIILLTMVMIVRERRREIGVLKAIGASDMKVTSQFMVEAGTFTLIAAVIGIVVALLAANPLTSTLVNNASSSSTTTQGGPGGGGGRMMGAIGNTAANLREISAVVDWSIVLYGLGTALLIAMIGAIVASWFITKVRPAEAVRAE